MNQKTFGAIEEHPIKKIRIEISKERNFYSYIKYTIKKRIDTQFFVENGQEILSSFQFKWDFLHVLAVFEITWNSTLNPFSTKIYSKILETNIATFKPFEMNKYLLNY